MPSAEQPDAGPDQLASDPEQLRELREELFSWFEAHGRDLPWRRAGTTAWGVLVSEVMSHQTPIARVTPAWEAWLSRWPSPQALAAAAPGDAIRAWGRLGYPRRALRLHEAAVAVATRHGGVVPEDEAELRALPGVGRYTAAAVRAFAFGRRSTVLDTNVRRVLARLFAGHARPVAPSPSVVERQTAEALVPDHEDESVRWNVAVMELGALVCLARSPQCTVCPVATHCAWRSRDFPVYETALPRRQAWIGTDRQVRGTLMAAVREASGAVSRAQLDLAWPGDPVRRERIITSLLTDGLLELLPGDEFCLPGTNAG